MKVLNNRGSSLLWMVILFFALPILAILAVICVYWTTAFGHGSLQITSAEAGIRIVGASILACLAICIGLIFFSVWRTFLAAKQAFGSTPSIRIISLGLAAFFFRGAVTAMIVEPLRAAIRFLTESLVLIGDPRDAGIHIRSAEITWNDFIQVT